MDFILIRNRDKMRKRNSYKGDVLRQACLLYSELSLIKENAGMFIGAKNKGYPNAFNDIKQRAKSLIKKIDDIGLSDFDIFDKSIKDIKSLYDLEN